MKLTIQMPTGLTGEDLAEVDLLPVEADAAAGGDGDRHGLGPRSSIAVNAAGRTLAGSHPASY
jgi:hypothetical protein